MSEENGSIAEPYSLAMIVRNCAEKLDACLQSYAQFPDDIVIVNTALTKDEEGFQETNDVARKHGARVFHFPWTDDFAAARNFSFSKTDHDFVMWLDSDDIVDQPHRLDRNIRKALSMGADWLLLDYDYEHDEHGNCTTRLQRERVVDKRIFEWRSPIHECLCANFGSSGARIPPQGGRIIHDQVRSDHATIQGKLRRNIEIFKKEFEAGECENRMLFYWGNTLFGLGDLNGAIEKFSEYVKKDRNWSQVIISLTNMSECYRILRDFDKALDAAMQAIKINPMLPSAWMMAAEAYLLLNRYDRAVDFANECTSRVGNLPEETVCNPTSLQGRPAWIRAFCLGRQGHLEAARKEAEAALKIWPDNPEMITVLKNVDANIKGARMQQAFGTLRDGLLEEDREKEVQLLARIAPTPIAGQAEIHQWLPKVRPKNKKSIAFLTYDMPCTWGPADIKVGGIGGSEEAIINMSREFSRMGWHVEVYASIDKITRDEGVIWYPLRHFTGDRDNPLDVLIVWRSPSTVLEAGCNAKQVYLWLHDMPVKEQWGYGSWNFYHGVFVLSDFHSGVHDFIPEEKKIQSANGMDPDLLVPIDELTNEPHRMIYPSDPIRGFDHVLEQWPFIREHVPDAEVDVFYGWSPMYMTHMKQTIAAGDFHMKQFYEKVEKAKNQPGVNWHGRVDQVTLAKAFAKAGVWGYPTEFPEISCITAMKAQAHGCIPVVTDDFALKETVQYGHKVPGPMSNASKRRNWACKVVTTMSGLDPIVKQREEMIRWARGLFTWERVARQWEGVFETSSGPRRLYRRGDRQSLIPIYRGQETASSCS